MNRQASKVRYAGLVAIVACGMFAASLYAQPGFGPKGKGGKGAVKGEFVTVRGSVREFTIAKKGETDGAILSDGTFVHWPPHMADRFTNLVVQGDKVKAEGWMETGPKGDTKLEVSTLTNLRTNKVAINEDLPPGDGPAATGRVGPIEDRLQAIENRLDRLTRDLERLLSKK